MALEVDYLPFATASDANVVTQATYEAAAWVLTGFTPGLAQSAEANKVWRQASMVAAAVANFISNQLGINVLDDGNLSGLVTNLTSAIGQVAKNAREVTSSAPLAIAISDYHIGLNRSAAPAAMVANAPPTPFNGQEIVVDDLYGNFFAYPVTFTPAAGQTMSGGRANYKMNEDLGSWTFTFYAATNTWSVKAS